MTVSKQQSPGSDKASPKNRAPKPVTENLDTLAAQQTHPAAIVQRARLDPRSLTTRDVLQLQRTIGNQAAVRLLAPRAQRQRIQESAPLHGAIIQRALNPGEADTLTDRAGQLGDRLDQIILRLPGVIGNQVATDDFMDPIRHVTNSARHNAAAVDFAPLTQMLDTAEQAINGLDRIVTVHQADFDAIGRAYNAVPAGDRAAMFGDLAAQFTRLGKRIAEKAAGAADISVIRLAVERALIPDNKEIKRMRAQNAQTAMDRVAMMVQAKLADVGNLRDLYASEFDAAADHFGASWSLKPAAGTGKLQWVTEWEFHVHATVQRAAAPPNAVTGFTIHRAHIKPSSGARELGVSIQITNPALLAQVQNDNQRKIVNWSGTPDGESILKKIKR